MISENIYINNYPMYGLNRYRSFMAAPECECGCGERGYMLLSDHEAVAEFCVTVLSEHECPDSAVFAVFNDGHYEAFVKTSDEKEKIIDIGSNDLHMFSEIDGQFRLCCYNLIIEEKPGQWMIQS